MTNQFSAEELAEHMMGLRASANVIETMITAFSKSDGNRERMDNNIRHIEIMCAMPHIASSGIDLSPYARAVELGKAWLAQD